MSSVVIYSNLNILSNPIVMSEYGESLGRIFLEIPMRVLFTHLPVFSYFRRKLVKYFATYIILEASIFYVFDVKQLLRVDLTQSYWENMNSPTQVFVDFANKSCLILLIDHNYYMLFAYIVV